MINNHFSQLKITIEQILFRLELTCLRLEIFSIKSLLDSNYVIEPSVYYCHQGNFIVVREESRIHQFDHFMICYFVNKFYLIVSHHVQNSFLWCAAFWSQVDGRCEIKDLWKDEDKLCFVLLKNRRKTCEDREVFMIVKNFVCKVPFLVLGKVYVFHNVRNSFLFSQLLKRFITSR